MIRELSIYSLAPVAVLLTWAYQRLADRYRDRHHSAWSMQDHLRGSAAANSVETQRPAADSSDSGVGCRPLNDRVDSSRETATARTEPAVESTPPELDRGPQQPVDVADPRHGVDWRTNPGDPGGADAVVPEPAASARSAA